MYVGTDEALSGWSSPGLNSPCNINGNNECGSAPFEIAFLLITTHNLYNIILTCIDPNYEQSFVPYDSQNVLFISCQVWRSLTYTMVSCLSSSNPSFH